MQTKTRSPAFGATPFLSLSSSSPTNLLSYFPSGRQLCIFYMDEGRDTDQETRKRNKKKKSGIAVEPWGGNGGFVWDDGEYSGIREIILYAGCCIDSITAVYDDNGKRVESEKHGGDGGQRNEIKLEYPKEFLVGLIGRHSPFHTLATPVIRSLMFRSNLRTYGPYGIEDGTPFVFQMEGGQIAGFKGVSSYFLEALGFYITSAPTKQKTQKAPNNHGMLESRIQHCDQYESSSWEDSWPQVSRV